MAKCAQCSKYYVMLTNGLVPFCDKKWSIRERIQTGGTQPVDPSWPRARKVTSILVPQFPGYLVTWLPDTGYLVLFCILG